MLCALSAGDQINEAFGFCCSARGLLQKPTHPTEHSWRLNYQPKQVIQNDVVHSELTTEQAAFYSLFF